MREFFKINQNYKFEINDLRSFLTILNVVLILIFGLSFAWFPLIIAGFGIVKDLTIDKKINGLLMHLANFILNFYFLLIFYTK